MLKPSNGLEREGLVTTKRCRDMLAEYAARGT
jgi:hypothetical protein